MRKMFALITLSIILCGCSERGDQPQLARLARGISEAMQPAHADFALEIRAVQRGSQVTLHCVLRNVSIAKNAIEVDASTLPWRNADLFEINAVAANGKVVHRNPPPVEIARISGPPTPLTINASSAIEGDIDLGTMPISGLPRGEDLLLLWSTSIREFNSDYAPLRGVTFLGAKS